MDLLVLQQLEKIHDELLGCITAIEIGLDNSEQAEQHIIRYLNKLLNLANGVSELQHLSTPIQYAMETFDIEYILNELQSLLGE